MFRIIIENETKIHIEGFSIIKGFDTKHISVCTREYCIDICGENFVIAELGNSDLQIAGTVASVNYTRISKEMN